MTAAAKKAVKRASKPLRQVKAKAVKAVKAHVGSDTSSKMMNLSNQASTIYTEAMKRVRKQPREAAGLCLGLGILASMVIWYRFVK